MNAALSDIYGVIPCEVAKATLSASLQEMVEILLTSSNHVLKSRVILPSHGFALLR